MTDAHSTPGFLRELDWTDLALIAAILVGSRLLVLTMRRAIGRAAERAPTRLRLAVLKWAPKARLLVEIGMIVAIPPVLVEPTFRNSMGLIASVGLALAFALKDYGSCLIAGLVTIMEGTYQPDDWIEVIVPHSRLWLASMQQSTEAVCRLSR